MIRVYPRVSTSAEDEHWNLRVRQHLLRLAAEQHRLDAAAAMGRHEDQADPVAPGDVDDRPVRLVVDFEHAGAGHTLRLRGIGDALQYAAAVRLHALAHGFGRS